MRKPTQKQSITTAKFRTIEGFKDWASENGSEVESEHEHRGGPLVWMSARFPYGILSIGFDRSTGRIVEGSAHCTTMSYGLGSNSLAVLGRLVLTGSPI
jgi:hypothetical protein